MAMNVTSFIFATFLTAGFYDEISYTDNVINWVEMLKCQGIPERNMLVIIADRIDVKDYEKLLELNIILRHVPVIKSEKVGHPRYQKILTKIWLWNFTEWNTRIVYYDSDMFFLRDPMECVNMCPPHALLCAVSDPVATWPVMDKNYFNGGFLILKPNRTTFSQLLQEAMTNKYREFGDQNLINIFFRNRWYELQRKCNFLHAVEDINEDDYDQVVAVHEKVKKFRTLKPLVQKIQKCINFT